MSRVTLLNRIIEEGLWEDFIAFASFMRREKRYSIFNSALIYLQRPGALYVDTETGWNKNKRYIGPGVTPIVVVHPFGPVNFVYEYADTYGGNGSRTSTAIFPRSLYRASCDSISKGNAS